MRRWRSRCRTRRSTRQTIERFRARLLAALAGRQVDAPKLQDLASQRREELKSLDAAIAVGEARQDLARAAFKPSLAFGAEAGIQGTEYGFADEDRYVLASLVLRFNAFRGGADQAALREARALTDQLRATRELAGQRVRLEVQQALENFEVAEASLETAAKRAEAATGAFTITSRKRDLGQINQAEFIDARRAQTDAQLNVTRVRAEYLARLAELEFSIGDARRTGPGADANEASVEGGARRGRCGACSAPAAPKGRATRLTRSPPPCARCRWPASP